MTIIIQTNTSEKEKLDKTVTTIATLTGTMRDESSIIDPVILLEQPIPDVKFANYMTIPEFGRMYYITDIRTYRNGLTEVYGHVDVLSSFASQIRANSAILKRSERNWNLYLNDGSLMVQQNPTVITQEFSNGGALGTGSSYILVLAG